MPRDYYEILGVERRANDQEIKKAFRRLAQQYHPDVSDDPEAQTKFQEANEAYQILSDPEKRRAYDQFGHAGVNAGGFSGGFNAADISDIFEEFMGAFTGRRGGSGRRRARQGRDLRYDLNLTFEQAIFGDDIDIEITRLETCEVCGGTGAEPGTEPTTCPTCNGTGQIRQMRQMFLGNMVVTSDCPTCGGSGQVIETPCHNCAGTGKVRNTTTLNISVPAGVDDGTQIRLSGEGEPGEMGGPPGNLYVVLHVREHEFFKRRGTDILLEKYINVAQATLGDVLSVPTVEGDEEINIEPGTQTGTIIKLKNKGVPKLRADGSVVGRGDQLVVVNVVIPTKLTPEQRELFEQLGHSLGTDVKPPQTSKGFFDRVANLFGGD